MKYEESFRAALAVAAHHGFMCFPMRSDKRPTTPHGFHAATRNPTTLEGLWLDYPGPLVGVRTGEATGIDALDLDSKHPESHAWWIANRARLPLTRTHRTRSGGLHFYFRHAPHLRCSTSQVAKGVDIKADGGCVIWWPAAGFPVLADAPIAAWPSWLMEVLNPHPREPQVDRVVIPDDRQLRRLAEVVRTAPEGQRNAIAYWAAKRVARMVESGLLGQATARALIIDAARAAKLPYPEARAIAKSAGLGVST